MSALSTLQLEMSRYRRLPRTVFLLCFGTLVNRAGSFVIMFLTIYLADELDFGTTFATRCIGIFGLGSIIAAIVGGHLADRFGRRVVMVGSFFGSAGILVVMATLRDVWTISAAVFLFGLINDMHRPAVSAMLGDLVPSEQRTHAFSMLYIAINLGFSVGALAGALIVQHSFAWLFYGDAITTALFGVVILLAIPESAPGAAPSERDDDASDDDDTTVRERSGADIPFVEAARRILADGTFVLFCTATLLIAFVFMQGMSTLPLHMKMQGIEPHVYARLMAINGLMIVVLQLPITSVFQRHNRMSIITVGGLLVGIGFYLTGIAASTAFFAVTVILWTIGEMFQAPFKNSVVTDLAPPELRARYMGIFTMCFSSAMMLGAPIGGEVLDRFGAEVLWNGSGVVSALALAVYILIHRKVVARGAAHAAAPGRSRGES